VIDIGSGKASEFVDLLRLIDERSPAFRAAAASAPNLDVQVPTCSEWTLFDLVKHLGEGRRKWAAIVAAGPAAAPPARSAWGRPGRTRTCDPERASRGCCRSALLADECPDPPG
jgi:hypothetical protein